MKRAVFTVNPIDGREYYHGFEEEEEKMTISEFVRTIWENDSYGSNAEPMDIETARTDIRNFAADGVEMPDDLTPKSYMEAWNELVGG